VDDWRRGQGGGGTGVAAGQGVGDGTVRVAGVDTRGHLLVGLADAKAQLSSEARPPPPPQSCLLPGYGRRVSPSPRRDAPGRQCRWRQSRLCPGETLGQVGVPPPQRPSSGSTGGTSASSDQVNSASSRVPGARSCFVPTARSSRSSTSRRTPFPPHRRRSDPRAASLCSPSGRPVSYSVYRP
jgi:hypothetical protein